MKTTTKLTGLCFAAGFLAAATSYAQTSKSTSTVRIKKVETINGVKKVTDTTYTSTDPASIIISDGTIDISDLPGEGHGETMRMVIRNNATARGSANGNLALSDSLEEQINIEVEQALKEAGIDQNMVKGEKIIILNGTEVGKNGTSKNVTVTRTMVKRIDIKDADESELKRLGQSTGTKNQGLSVSNMNFYPNPSNGKFNLSFSLPESGNTDVTILNSEGKVVYKENLPSFSGNYDKEIDISKQARGIYFVKVEQGKHSQVKKIVLE